MIGVSLLVLEKGLADKCHSDRRPSLLFPLVSTGITCHSRSRALCPTVGYVRRIGEKACPYCRRASFGSLGTCDHGGQGG